MSGTGSKSLRPDHIARQGAHVKLIKRIYPHYNLLIDICFWALLLYYFRAFLIGIDVPKAWLLASNPTFNLVLRIAVAIIQFGAVVLIFMSRLRDEYAERLWHRAASTYVKFVLISPFLWMPFLVVLSQTEGGLDWYSAHPQEPLLPHGKRMPNPNNSLGILQFEVINFLVAKLFALLPLLFTGFYKWHRWRDSR